MRNLLATYSSRNGSLSRNKKNPGSAVVRLSIFWCYILPEDGPVWPKHVVSSFLIYIIKIASCDRWWVFFITVLTFGTNSLTACDPAMNSQIAFCQIVCDWHWFSLFECYVRWSGRRKYYLQLQGSSGTRSICTFIPDLTGTHPIRQYSVYKIVGGQLNFTYVLY
jgi:hypothetical protein